ncbi:hypothetical protein GCM10008983_13850 [Lentibacillus halophilus]|uniref:Uncharacterized protein n=1 Tax=Lentibacillus halophilus TaxID=295065 RepID=A0ABP3J261_9BACI
MRYLTDDELHLASRFLFLSMAITVIQQDIQHIQAGTFKIKEPYLNLLEAMNTKAINERNDLRKMMRDRNVQVVALNKSHSFSSYLFVCSGREEKRNYFNPVIRKRVKSIMQELMDKVQPPHQHDPAAHT